MQDFAAQITIAYLLVSIRQGIFRRCSITHLSFLEAKLFQIFLRVEDNHKVLYSQGSSPTQVARFCSTTSYRLLTCFNASISQDIFRCCSITHLSFLEAKLFQIFLRVEDNHQVLYSQGSSPTQVARF